MKFRFKEFRVYKEAKEYCKFARDAAKKHIERHDKGLNDQIQRALSSIVLNIAEGSAGKSDTEFARFFSISIRSIYETVAGFDLALLYRFIDEDLNQAVEEQAHALVKQLASFRNKLKS